MAHYDRVHAICRRMLGNDKDAEDATQETLLLAVRSLSRFDGRSSFGTWTYRIATNACIDELRRRRRRPLLGLDGLDGADPSEARGTLPLGALTTAPALHASRDVAGTKLHGSRHPRPAFGAASVDPAVAAAGRVDVDAALSTLPVEFRVAVVLRDLCDLPYDEIAQVLDVPTGTVRSRIARGRAVLADLLAEPGNLKDRPGVEESGREEIDR